MRKKHVHILMSKRSTNKEFVKGAIMLCGFIVIIIALLISSEFANANNSIIGTPDADNLILCNTTKTHCIFR